MNIRKTICIAILMVCAVSFVFSEAAERTATIVYLEGEASVKKAGKAVWAPAAVDIKLKEGDVFKTAVGAWAIVKLNGDGDTAEIEVEENSHLTFTELLMDEKAKTQTTLLDLAIGKVLIKAQKIHSPDSKFEVKTPASIVGVRGTKFSVKVEALEE